VTRFSRCIPERVLNNQRVFRALSNLLPRPPIRVDIVYRTSYLTCYYGLNRFLTLLLSTYVERQFGHRTLHPSSKIERITPTAPASHACTMTTVGGKQQANGSYVGGMLYRHACFGEQHDVFFEPGSTMTFGQFNVVIVRHGQRFGPVLVRSRHLMPYHRP
jgi:hypothetical protein